MKLKTIVLALIVVALSLPCQAQKKAKKAKKQATTEVGVQPTWESINQRGYPEWFSDAKLGIFIHWGLYSVPAWAGKEGYAEWYYRGMMVGQKERLEVLRTYLEKNGIDLYDTTVSTFDKYAVLTDYWKAEMWKPDDWAKLFKEAGAQYILLVTKHHDGYCLWPSEYQPTWNSTVSGPKRDIVGETAEAMRKEGIRFGAYYSLAEWTNPRHIWMEDPNDSIADYVENYMIPQFKEMITKYRPEVLFTDGEWFNTAEQWHARELISWYYNQMGPEAICNDRWGSGQEHGYRTPEYSAGITQTDRPWAECRGLGRSFGFNRAEPIENYLTSDELIQHFCKLVSAGGGMTLNVGPYADGTIPLLQVERLKDLGAWLKVNGEAIYGTRPYKKFYDTKQVSISRKDEKIFFDWKRNSPDRAIAYDDFTGIWSGTVVPTQSGEYTIRLWADDSASFSIQDLDDATARNSFIISTKDTAELRLALQAGHRYLMFVNYQEHDLEAEIYLTWSSHTMKEQPLKPLDGWEATFTCEQPYVVYTTKGDALYAIFLGWEDSPTLPLDFAPRSVSLLGCDKPVSYSYDTDAQQIKLNTSNLTYGDISRNRAAWVFKFEGLTPSTK